MSWKSLVYTGLVCGVMTLPAMAQTLSVVNGGLDANGDWVWNVMVDPDDAGGSVATEVGFSLSGADLMGIALGDAMWDTPNPHNEIFSGGWEDTSGDDDDGVQSSGNEAVAAVGSDVFAAAAGPSALATITAVGPSYTGGGAANFPSTTVDWTGAYMADGLTTGGTNGILAQQGNTVTVTGSTSRNTLPGDANLDGTFDFSDIGIISPFFNGAAHWGQGDTNGDGTFDFSDIGIISPFFNMSVGAGSGSSAVPEPSTLALILIASLAAVGRAKRR